MTDLVRRPHPRPPAVIVARPVARVARVVEVTEPASPIWHILAIVAFQLIALGIVIGWWLFG